MLEHLAGARNHADYQVVVCGPDGSGKSTLLNHFLASLDRQSLFAVLNETCLNAEQFYCAFLQQIGFEDISGSVNELHNITREFLRHRGNADDHVLIAIDNAHQVNPAVLEQLRRISEIKVDGRRVLSVVLTGSNDLLRVIDAPAMKRTKFRSRVVFGIRCFTEEETASYVWHCLRLAGQNNGVNLPKEAHALIHRYSGGIPHQINKLCSDLLAQAHSLKSRVITEKIVRTVADKLQLVPHVAPMHGKGRRETDPDFNRMRSVPVTEPETEAGKSSTDKPDQGSAVTVADADPEYLAKQAAQLSKQVDDLRADKMRALQEIDERNKDISLLRNELGTKASEIESLKRFLDINVKKIDQQNQALSQSVAALQDREGTSEKLATDLEEESRRREAAESELVQVRATVDELSRLQQELQAQLNVADERAVQIEVFEANAADLRKTLDETAGELNSRNQDLADIEKQLEQSRDECASAERRISALKSPNELQEIVAASDKLAADLEQETCKREAAESELAKAEATVNDLTELKQGLQATVDELQAQLKVVDERAVQIEVFEANAADLRKTLDETAGELNSRNQDLADIEKQLEQSRDECASAERRISALTSPNELQEIVAASDKLAADLEQETCKREAAESGLAKAEATVNDLTELKQGLQATVDELQAQLKVADERAVEIEALEQNVAVLNNEIEGQTGELKSLREDVKSRDRDLADLGTRFVEVQRAYEVAQLRMVALKSPSEIQAIEEASIKLAAELEEETRRRTAVERELAEAKATADELIHLKQELQAAIDKSQVQLKVAHERAVEIEALEKNTADLKDEIEGKVGELEALREELESRDQASADLKARLEDSQNECEKLRRRAAASGSVEDSVSDVEISASTRYTGIHSSRVVANFDKSLRQVPAYKALLDHDPAFYESLVARYKELIGMDHTDKQVKDDLRAKQAKLIEKLLPQASDEAIFSYARSIVEQLIEFHRDGTEPCFTLLVPKSDPNNNAPPIYSDKSKEAELETLDLTLRTYDAKRRLPTEEEVWPDLEPIFDQLFEAYGEDSVAAIQGAYDPGIDRHLTCEVTRTLYSEILDLSKPKAVQALRWILSP